MEEIINDLYQTLDNKNLSDDVIIEYIKRYDDIVGNYSDVKNLSFSMGAYVPDDEDPDIYIIKVFRMYVDKVTYNNKLGKIINSREKETNEILTNYGYDIEDIIYNSRLVQLLLKI